MYNSRSISINWFPPTDVNFSSRVRNMEKSTSFVVLLQCFLTFARSQETIDIPTAAEFYQLQYSITDQIITFEVSAQTTGWIGLGFTNISGMTQSDIFIGGVNDGVPYFGDYSSVTVGTPSRDTQEDWTLLNSTEVEGWTYLKFSRNLVTNDLRDIAVTDSLMNIIWAIGETDVLTYHRFGRSTLKFNLISGIDGGEPPEPPPTSPAPSTTTTGSPTTAGTSSSTTISTGSTSSTTPRPITDITIPTAADFYQLQYSISDDAITFEVRAQTTGWVGLGFTNISGMTQGDIFIGGVNGGAPYFGDYSSVTAGTPSKDTQEDWSLLNSTEIEGWTYLKFSRNLVTNDAQDIAITEGLMNIIWAIGGTDTLGYHNFGRSSLKFNLISGIDGGETPEPPPTSPAPSTTTTGSPTTTSTRSPTSSTTMSTGSTSSTTPRPFIDIPTAADFYQLQYSITGDIITFEVRAQTTGWVGLGFTNISGMTQADIFIGGVNGGVPYSGDYSSVTVGTPSRDTQEDWNLLNSTEIEGWTYLKFSRNLVTNDAQDIAITDKLMSIIWAIGETDILAYHGFGRSNLKFNLISGTDGGDVPEPPPSTVATTVPIS